jgi:hypothetical protein
MRASWKKPFFWNKVFPSLVCMGILTACLYPSPKDSLPGEKQAPKPSSVFSHKVHEDILKQYHFHCTDCHLYDLAYKERDKKINEELTRAITRAGMESCHFCHTTHTEQVKVALKCVACHADIRPIIPADHRAGWKTTHANKIALSKVSCTQCHSNRFCVKCHSRRDEADRVYHTGAAIVSHPIEARVDPAKCQKCHTSAYCVRCHKSGRF